VAAVPVGAAERDRLALARAEAVRRVLLDEHGVEAWRVAIAVAPPEPAAETASVASAAGDAAPPAAPGVELELAPASPPARP
jgi:hypothetical protein